MSAAAPTGLKDLGVRVGTALVLGAVMLTALLFGGAWALAAVIAVIAAAATSEFYVIVRREHRLFSEIIGLGAVVSMPFVAAQYGPVGLTVVVSALIVSAFFWHIMIRPVRLIDTTTTIFGAVYIGFTLAHLLLIRQFADGVTLALALFVGIWANDVFAYVIGSTLGRRPLAPRISPKKSWEGLAAGTIGTVAVWALLPPALGVEIGFGWRLAIGTAASVAAVIGDLAESRIKREFAVKDSGRLLPGHGGFLDRFDSLITATIVTYYLLMAAGVR